MSAKTWTPLIAAAIIWLALRWIASQSVFFPMKHPAGWWGLQTEIGAEDVWLTASDGVRVHGWFVAAAKPGLTTVFLHGNAGNITHRVRSIRPIVAAGSSVLIIDYRGYGKSAGSPSEDGVYRDAEAAYEFAAKRGEPIVLHGESLGTAVAVELAKRRGCAGLVLEAPFPSARAVAASVIPVVGATLISGLDSKSKIGAVRCPLLVLHGDRDDVIAFRLGEELFRAANEPKEFWRIAGAGHNDIVETAGSEYEKKLREFHGRLGAL